MGRYQTADQTYDMEGSLRLAPEGHCNWCGKTLPKRCRVFCPSIKRVIGPGYSYRIQECAVAFFHLWQAIPRFKRVVYIRDDFTCQICALRPRTTNPHGLEMPDLSLLAIDHIYPYSKGGATEPDNLQVLCRECNSKKRAKIEYAPQGNFDLE